jgi:lysophosphatidate acyltransferase
MLYHLFLSLVSYLALTITFFIMSLLFPTIATLGFIARLLSSYASLLFCTSYGVFASLALRLAGMPGLAQWATGRFFALVMRYTTGVRFVIVDGEHHLTAKRPMVIIGNHQTELDVLLLGRIFPRYCSVTAKKSLARVPFLGWFMSLSGTVFIDRVDRSQAMKAFEGAVREMKSHNQSVFIFPEGTRSYAREPTMLPFKKGAFHLAVQAGVDICPVVAENYSRVLDVKAKRFVSGIIRVKGLLALPFPLPPSLPFPSLFSRKSQC